MRRTADPLAGGIKQAKKIPFDFVLDELASLGPTTRPMFGCTSVYVDDRIVFILRDKGESDADNGVWLAYQPEHEAEIFALFPSLERIHVFENDVKGWRKLSSRSPEFEDAVLDACARIRARDMRFGKVPGAKKPSKAKAAKAKK